MYRFAVIATATLLAASSAWAGLVLPPHQIAEIVQAPLLAVGTVRGVSARELVSDAGSRWKEQGRYYDAKVLVNRAFGAASIRPGMTITVRYISYDPNLSVAVNGVPQWPVLRSGDVALFPLKPSGEGNWRVWIDEGRNMLAPAIAKEWNGHADSARAFVLRELANALTRGTYIEQNRAAYYLANEREEPTELRGLLEALNGVDDDKWLETAALLVKVTGVPRQRVSDLMAGRVEASISSHSIPSLAAWALRMGASRDYPGRLISALVARNCYEALQEFRDSPFVEREVITALRRRDPESMMLAFGLIRTGSAGLANEAVEAAMKVVQNPAAVSDGSVLSSASYLIVNYGSEAQVDSLTGLLRRFQTTDENQYRKLWSAIDGLENKRALRLAAIVVTDRRMLGKDVRYCDTALGEISRVSGEEFWPGVGSSSAERDRGIEKAIAWLRSNGLL